MLKIDEILQNIDQTLCEQIMPKGQSCSTPLNPGIYAGFDSPLIIQIPEIPSAILNSLKLIKTIKIELTLIDSKSNDLACMWTKIDIHVPDPNSGMKMFNSNLIILSLIHI